jgi:hypothetical protein
VPGTCTAIASATDQLFDSAVAAEFIPVVTSIARGKSYGVETIQVDNVPDVIRSRRHGDATFKAVVSA